MSTHQDIFKLYHILFNLNIDIEKCKKLETWVYLLNVVGPITVAITEECKSYA